MIARLFKLGAGMTMEILEVNGFGVERSKVNVRVRVQQFGVGLNSMSAF